MSIIKLLGCVANRRQANFGTPAEELKPREHSSTSADTDPLDSMDLGCLSLFTGLKKIPQKAGSRWDRLLNSFRRTSNSGMELRKTESSGHKSLLSVNNIQDFKRDSLIKPSKKVLPLSTKQGDENRLSINSTMHTRFIPDPSSLEVDDTHIAPNKTAVSESLMSKSVITESLPSPTEREFIDSFIGFDFDEDTQTKLPLQLSREGIDKLAATAKPNESIKRNFILTHKLTSRHALYSLYADASSKERSEIFAHSAFRTVSEHALFSMVRYVKNTPLTARQRLAILEHENADGDVYSEFFRCHFPDNISKDERLAIARSPKANMKHLGTLLKTLPEDNDDALKEMLAIIMNPHLDADGVELVLKHLPPHERTKIVNDPHAPPFVISYIAQRMRLPEVEMQECKAFESQEVNTPGYQNELNALLENRKIYDDDLSALVLYANIAQRKKILEHDNARDTFALSSLAKTSESQEECSEIWKRTVYICSKFDDVCYNTRTALQNNNNCPIGVLKNIIKAFAEYEEGADARRSKAFDDFYGRGHR